MGVALLKAELEAMSAWPLPAPIPLREVPSPSTQEAIDEFMRALGSGPINRVPKTIRL